MHRPARVASGLQARAISHNYFCLPGNVGLSTSGAFLARSLRPHLARAQSRIPFDLIHAHAALPCGEAAARLSQALGIPFVVTAHGLDAFSVQQAGPLFRNSCRSASFRVYKEASSVVCISHAVSRQILAEMPLTRTVTIHNGVDADLFSFGEETPPPTILSVGNLIPIKGHALLVRALARILQSNPNCSLEIIGDGPELPHLSALADNLGIESNVRFLGAQSREAVASAMKRCTVFALPSRYEGLGCVYLEAMACAKPAIGCRGQGIEEIIEHGKNGLLVQPDDADELSMALTTLLTNREYRLRLGLAARDTILRKHTLNHQARQLAALYKECAS
jgi:glycosyltransferase involved in cell wall biosynthesis